MVIQSINPRKIDLKYSKNFKRSVAQKTLQNKKVENAIIVGVKREWIDVTSLEPMHEGVYTNSVVWAKSHFPSEESILFNGNHRFNYMKTEDPSRWSYHRYAVAKTNLKNATNPEDRQRHQAEINIAKEVIRIDGVWLVKFIDLGEWHKYTIYLRHADTFFGAIRCDQEKQGPLLTGTSSGDQLTARKS